MKELLEWTGTRLYRGTGLTIKDLSAYKAKIGKKVKKYEGKEYEREIPDYAVLTGFISTSMDRAQAESFAWSNDESGHQPTLFDIMWK